MFCDSFIEYVVKYKLTITRIKVPITFFFFYLSMNRLAEVTNYNFVHGILAFDLLAHARLINPWQSCFSVCN